MTHFAGLVLVNKETAAGAIDVGEGRAFSAVAALVDRYCESDEWGEDGTRYDWFMVGGRFTGLLDNYDPTQDEANFEYCEYCEGTGVTTQAVADKYPAYQPNVGKPCIQCAVTVRVGGDDEEKRIPGRRLRWSTDWVPHDSDVMLTSDVDVDKMRYIPNVLVTPDGEWHEQHRIGLFVSHLPKEDGSIDPSEEGWNHEFRALLAQHRDTTLAVVVDFHV